MNPVTLRNGPRSNGGYLYGAVLWTQKWNSTLVFFLVTAVLFLITAVLFLIIPVFKQLMNASFHYLDAIITVVNISNHRGDHRCERYSCERGFEVQGYNVPSNTLHIKVLYPKESVNISPIKLLSPKGTSN